MSKIVYTGVTFYIVLIVLLSILGVNQAQNVDLEFPEIPNVDDVDDIPVLNQLFAVGEFLAFLLLVLGFIGDLLLFKLPKAIPTWLNVILFLPLVILILYEVTARLIRGS